MEDPLVARSFSCSLGIVLEDPSVLNQHSRWQLQMLLFEQPEQTEFFLLSVLLVDSFELVEMQASCCACRAVSWCFVVLG